MIKAILFDVDGTLVDSVDLHAKAWQRVLTKWGHKVGFDEVRGQIGKGGDQLMPMFLSKEDVERDGEAIEKERGALFKDEFLAQVRPFPEVAALFRRVLASGRQVALASSGKMGEIEHYRRLLGIDEMDLVVTSSEDAEKSKPHPDIFQAAVQKLGVDAGAVVAVGDSPFDAIAAGRGGILSIGVLCGGFPAEALREAGYRELYADPADLLARFAGSLLAA